jgi:hypothetical protein
MLGWIDKAAGAYIDWRMRANMTRLEDVRIESVKLSEREGKPTFEVQASFAAIADFSFRCIALLEGMDAKNFVTFTMMPRPDHGNRPIEVTVRYADTGLPPAVVIKRLDAGMRYIVGVGHNDDCMFCGFKDKKVKETMEALGHAL